MVKYVGKGRNTKPEPPRGEGWEAYFDAGEHLVWQGQPNKGLRFRVETLMQSLFGVFFLAFAIFWMAMASGMSSGMPREFGPVSLFPLFGIPFVLVGFYMVIGNYFWKAYLRGRTRYALSNKRAFIATRGLRKDLKSWPIDAQTELVYEPGDESTIFFASSTKRVYSKNSGSRTKTIRHGFEYINKGEEVYRKMRDLIAKGG